MLGFLSSPIRRSNPTRDEPSFEQRVDQVSEIVTKHFPFKEMYIDKLPRRRDGVRLARVKFAAYDVDDTAAADAAVEAIEADMIADDVDYRTINSFRSVAMLQRKHYSSILIFIPVDTR